MLRLAEVEQTKKQNMSFVAALYNEHMGALCDLTSFPVPLKIVTKICVSKGVSTDGLVYY